MSSTDASKPGPKDIRQIMELLPHRYPFLLVDRVTEINPGHSLSAYKCVTMNEPFFQGHFPGLPVMPGVLIIEALAQAGGVLVLTHLPPEEVKDSIFLFSGLDKVKFRRPVYPGDRLDLQCELVRHKLRMWKMRGVATVDGVVAAEVGEMTAVVTLKESI